MNVFIDSNILFEDYFFDNKSTKQILDYAQKGLITIYLSKIVFLELRRQYEKELEGWNAQIRKINKDTPRLLLSSGFGMINIPVQLAKFDEFYSDFEKRCDNFAILPYKNEYFPNIVDRAIRKSKPFTETKTELKDAIIWITYSEYVEQKYLSDCILLTNNVSDFCDKKDKSVVHKTLQVDTKKFVVVNSAFDFIKKYAPTIDSPEYIFEKYVDGLGIDNDFAFRNVRDNFDSIITTKVHEKINKLSASQIVSKNDSWFDGQLIGYDTELLYCEDVEYDVAGQRAIISGYLYLTCEVDALRYNPDRDPGEDSFIHEEEKNITFSVRFNFDMLQGEVCKDIEVLDIEIEDVY